jgi:hypothetical protein
MPLQGYGMMPQMQMGQMGSMGMMPPQPGMGMTMPQQMQVRPTRLCA